MSSNPARVFGLRSKGTLERGMDGDVVLVDMQSKGKIEPRKFFSKAHYSPFEGWKTQGAVHTTIVDGRIVYREGEIVERSGTGAVLRNGHE